MQSYLQQSQKSPLLKTANVPFNLGNPSSQILALDTLPLKPKRDEKRTPPGRDSHDKDVPHRSAIRIENEGELICRNDVADSGCACRDDLRDIDVGNSLGDLVYEGV
jgi:hypothetical protein